jgi:pimeloyl-ACP methyl ester carboxylesterase
MAKVATWDILRINRLGPVDGEEADDDILRFVASRITEARREGYKQIVVAGYSRGGWLALLAATLPNVDAAIGLAPGTAGARREALERTRDVLAQKLAGARTKRVAAFFFEGDPREDVSERRAAAIRRGLQKSGSAFIVVDRPPDLPGHSGGATGRFARRYRDCLLQFVRSADQPAGEVQCSRSSGYAVGSEIGFPAVRPALELPADADQALAPFLGRWEGDDKYGGYLILESIAVAPSQVTFKVGFSEHPGASITWIEDRPFQLDDELHGRIASRSPYGPDGCWATLKSATELDVDVVYSIHDKVSSRRFLLRKRGDEAADR